MKKLIYSILLGIMLFSPAYADKGEIVIGNSPGGLVQDWVSFYDMIKKSGVSVKIEGICISACTLVLSLPPEQICMLPTASFGFHLASDSEGPNPNLTLSFMNRYYPKSVKIWIEETLKGQPLTARPIYMTYEEAIKINLIRSCDEEK